MPEPPALSAAREALFAARDPDRAILLLTPLLAEPPADAVAGQTVGFLLGHAYLLARFYPQAAQLFRQMGDRYQAGYSELLQGRADAVAQDWQPLVAVRPNHWCLSLFGLVTRQLALQPSLIQVRNHLEMDVWHLIHAGQEAMLQNLLSYAELLAAINPEAPKFIGRAMLTSGRLQDAGDYLMMGLRHLPIDPEVYFHLAQWRLRLGDPEAARPLLKQCMMMAPPYWPAERLLQEIET